MLHMFKVEFILNTLYYILCPFKKKYNVLQFIHDKKEKLAKWKGLSSVWHG